MGNRATVIFWDGKARCSPAVYLHWNGGPESVYAFLEELDRRGVRADQDYEAARFIQLIGEFFDQDKGSGLSLGVANGPRAITPDALAKVQTDHGDNGFYIVNRVAEPMEVRRFRERYTGTGDSFSCRLVEFTPEEVSDERADADAHEYRESFRVVFTANGKAYEGR